jgi:copper(I)-binding protein
MVFLTACGMSQAVLKAGPFEMTQPVVMAAKTGGTTGAFMTIKNTGAQADRLVGASFAQAEMAQVHETVMENDVMTMREVPALEIPAGQAVELRHGSYHIMLMGLTADLTPGEVVTLTLKFEKAGEIVVPLTVMKP